MRASPANAEERVFTLHGMDLVRRLTPSGSKTQTTETNVE
jgi:hypothetical protein